MGNLFSDVGTREPELEKRRGGGVRGSEGALAELAQMVGPPCVCVHQTCQALKLRGLVAA